MICKVVSKGVKWLPKDVYQV